ncbi:hypothetical protein [Halosolutus halophilus]|uniref:hypothetical protein n=1 Tax=Halosolutus halophilus TaxID=1552990 RepID=UPI0022352AF9|nr:hypothetical protein [Halosolutus halophilus]
MHRRTLLLSVSAAGIGCIGGCLGSTECDETSNHLYIENQLAEPQEMDIRVMQKSDGLVADQEWTGIFSEYIELAGEEYRIVEGVYDEHGTYRTLAEQETGHEIISEQETSDIDSCHDQNITVGIADSRIDILHGVPDHLASETETDS